MKTSIEKRAVRGTWVQTERAAHEAWAELINRQPRAAALLHLIVANMSARGGLVASQATLASLMGVSTATVKRALTVLSDERWIEVVRVGSERGGVNAYIVNRRVAWADRRDNARYAAFDATILVSEAEQGGAIQDNAPPLRQLPTLAPGEHQLPAGEGAEPPSQPPISGLEPDLPSIAAGRDPNTIDWVSESV